MTNIVYIATSLDGFIADRYDGLDWLQAVPNPAGDDFGFGAFIDSIDALVMGRRTFEIVSGFEGDWPYPQPVFVLSSGRIDVPERLKGKVEPVQGAPGEIAEALAVKGFQRLYIDGGKTVQSFLSAGMVDEMIVTRIPVLLGAGVSLFGELPRSQSFTHVETKVFLDQLVQSHYQRIRS